MWEHTFKNEDNQDCLLQITKSKREVYSGIIAHSQKEFCSSSVYYKVSGFINKKLVIENQYNELLDKIVVAKELVKMKEFLMNYKSPTIEKSFEELLAECGFQKV